MTWKVGSQHGAAAVTAAAGNDPRAQTLGRLQTLMQGLPTPGYYLKIEGENTPLSRASIATALDKMEKGHAVSVVKDIGKGEGWGTSSYRRRTGNPRVAEFSGNMFKKASNDQLREFETTLRTHLANPNDVPKRWGG